jgi:hypothetical protein
MTSIKSSKLWLINEESGSSIFKEKLNNILNFNSLSSLKTNLEKIIKLKENIKYSIESSVHSLQAKSKINTSNVLRQDLFYGRTQSLDGLVDYYYQNNYHQSIIYYNNLILALIILFILFSVLILIEEDDSFYNISAISFILLVTFNLVIIIFSHNFAKHFLLCKPSLPTF